MKRGRLARALVMVLAATLLGVVDVGVGATGATAVAGEASANLAGTWAVAYNGKAAAYISWAITAGRGGLTGEVYNTVNTFPIGKHSGV